MDLSAAKSSFIRREVDVWGSLRSLRTTLARATERLSQQSAEVADLRLLCADLGAEAAAVRAEAQRRQSELDQVTSERDQSRDRAAKAESRAGALAADLAVAQAASSEQCARAGGMPWLF
jgi:chromosome segregation ATPase